MAKDIYINTSWINSHAKSSKQFKAASNQLAKKKSKFQLIMKESSNPIHCYPKVNRPSWDTTRIRFKSYIDALVCICRVCIERRRRVKPGKLRESENTQRGKSGNGKSKLQMMGLFYKAVGISWWVEDFLVFWIIYLFFNWLWFKSTSSILQSFYFFMFLWKMITNVEKTSLLTRDHNSVINKWITYF